MNPERIALHITVSAVAFTIFYWLTSSELLSEVPDGETARQPLSVLTLLAYAALVIGVASGAQLMMMFFSFWFNRNRRFR